MRNGNTIPNVFQMKPQFYSQLLEKKSSKHTLPFLDEPIVTKLRAGRPVFDFRQGQ